MRYSKDIFVWSFNKIYKNVLWKINQCKYFLESMQVKFICENKAYILGINCKHFKNIVLMQKR
jgi:hypothetical protein